MRLPMDSSSAAWGRVAVATGGVLFAGILAASASLGGWTATGDASAGAVSGEVARSGDAAVPTTSPAAHPEVEAAAEAEPAAVPTSTPSPPPPSTAPARRSVKPSTAGGSAAGAPALAEPVVRRPPPRPSRTSEAATQSDQVSTPVPASEATPPSTARYAQDFPDPFVWRAGPYWYAVSTQRGWTKVPLIRSLDLVHWEERGDALAALPRWSRFGALWAPSVLPVDGGFVLFYTTTEDATGLQCLSSAFAVLPDGPFVDASSGPLVCQRDRGGSIDPSPFRAADGRPWLTWKSEGTIDGEATRLWSQPLSADGRSLAAASAPNELLVTGLPWEGPIIEAPSMFVGADGAYHLLYSGNRWETSSYGIGHARCAGPAGPCRRSSDVPVATPHPSEAGAGGAEVLFDGASLRVAYHAWDPSAVGYPHGLRRLRIGDLRIGQDGSVRVEPVPR